MKNKSYFANILPSALAGLITAYSIVVINYRAELKTTLDWGIALVFLTLGAGGLYFTFLPSAWERFSKASTPIKIWSAIVVILSALAFSLGSTLLAFIPFLLSGFILCSYGLTAFEKLIEQKRSWRFILAWGSSTFVSFFAVGFFKNFHPTLWEFILLSILFNSVLTLLIDVILEEHVSFFQNINAERLISSGVLALGGVLIVLSIRTLVQYPSMFDVGFFMPAADSIPYFVGLAILSQSGAALLDQKLDSLNWRSSAFILWIKRNTPGLMLASAITTFAYLFATVLVSSDLRLADNYFDTDSPIWVNFLTANTGDVGPMRAVHPYAMLILRPLVWLLSLPISGDKFHAALLLNAIFGGACAFLTWYFFKHRTGNTAYALIIAALIGFSNGHMLLSVFLESYIFSATMLITAVLVFDKDRELDLKKALPIGLLTFGITVTNLIQTCITFLFTQWNLKKAIQLGMATLAIATVLNFAQNKIQPNNQLFFIPNNIGNEGAFHRDIIHVPISETVSRANVISRMIVLSSIAAPRPMILLEEIGCSTPCFNTIRYFGGKYLYASYIGFGSWLARSWFLLFFIAVLLFGWNFIKSPKDSSLQIALALNILFNFVLHMNYGDDPQLYAPNWTYAIVFLFGTSFEQFAGKKWFKFVMLLFLTALLINNMELFAKIVDAILPFGL